MKPRKLNFIAAVLCVPIIDALAFLQQHSPGQEVIASPAQEETTSTIRDSLLSSSIIPEVLDDFEPSYDLTLTYSSTHTSVQLGNDIPVPEVKEPPAFEIHAIPTYSFVAQIWEEHRVTKKKNYTYTLALTDPDAKSRDNPKWSEMCHWIVTNITVPDDTSFTLSLDYGNVDLNAASELVSYQPPGPPPKTGRHRYVFVLLRGEEGSKLEKPQERQHWGYGKKRHGVRQWAEENDLTVVGANWFYAMNKKQ